jgi:hypothetical protein
MKLFGRFNDSDFEPDFIEYAKSFRSYLISEFDVEETNLLDMIYSDNVKDNHDIESFIESQDENLNRTMLYVLLHEYDIEVGLKSRVSAHHDIYRMFAGEQKYIYKDHENISDFIYECGLSGVVHGFAVKNLDIKFEMTRIMYSDIQAEEQRMHEGFGWEFNAIAYLSSCARGILLGNEFSPDCINHDGIEIPEELINISSPGFYERSALDQEKLLRVAISRLKETDLENDEGYQDSYSIDITEIATKWPTEYGIACLILGLPACEIVSRVSKLSTVLLKIAGWTESNSELISDILIKRMLFSFPAEFKVVFPDLPPIEDCITKDIISDPGSERINDLLLKVLKLDFSWHAGLMGYGHKLITLANEIGYKTDDILPLIEVSENISILTLDSLVGNIDIAGKTAVVHVISRWLDALNHSNKTIGVLSLRESTALIAGLDDKRIFGQFNEQILRTINKQMNSKYATEKVVNGSYFLFKDEDHKKEFVNEIVSSGYVVTPSIIELGRFSQKDFSAHWGSLSRISRRSFIGKDLDL